MRPDGSRIVRSRAFDWYAHTGDYDMDALIPFLRSLNPSQ
jgi:hypothetical protein